MSNLTKKRAHNPLGASSLTIALLSVAAGAGIGAAVGAATRLAKAGSGIDCTQVPSGTYVCSRGAGAKEGTLLGTMIAGGVGLIVAASSEKLRDAGLATAGLALLAYPAEELYIQGTQPVA